MRHVTYDLLAIESGPDAVQTNLIYVACKLDYSQLLDPADSVVATLFGFLDLALSDQVTTRIHNVLNVCAGRTDQDVCFGGILSPDFIRARVTAIAPELRADIPAPGIDRRALWLVNDWDRWLPRICESWRVIRRLFRMA